MSENNHNKLVIADVQPTTDCLMKRESDSKVDEQNLVVEDQNQELTSYYT